MLSWTHSLLIALIVAALQEIANIIEECQERSHLTPPKPDPPQEPEQPEQQQANERLEQRMAWFEFERELTTMFTWLTPASVEQAVQNKAEPSESEPRFERLLEEGDE